MGRCLCGAVAYEVRGPLRDVLICHCEECRRWHGLRWVQSPHSDAGARRGFCAECGSGLFWDPPRRDTISIVAGTLDQPTGLRVAAHWFVSQAADYDTLPDDGLPRHERSAEQERRGDAP
jgi:hypothetical protein